MRFEYWLKAIIVGIGWIVPCVLVLEYSKDIILYFAVAALIVANILATTDTDRKSRKEEMK